MPMHDALEWLDRYYLTPDDRPPGYWDTLTQPKPLPRPRRPRGHRPQGHLTLTEEERQVLTHIAHHPNAMARYARAARLLLLVASGACITYIAQDVGLSRRHVYQWIRRYQQRGLDAVRPALTTGE